MTNTNISDGKPDHLSCLFGEQLSSVTFIQNYLQLEFDGRRLTLNEWPSVETTAGVARFGEPGYRDELCSLIGRLVAGAAASKEEVVIRFDGGDSIKVELAKSRFPVGDRIIFHDTTNESWSWW